MISDRYVVGLNAFPRDAAISVVQRFDDTAPPLFEIVFLERLDLDDSIVNYVHRFLQSPPLRDSGDVELVVGFGAGDTAVFDVCGFQVFTTMILVVGQVYYY